MRVAVGAAAAAVAVDAAAAGADAAAAAGASCASPSASAAHPTPVRRTRLLTTNARTMATPGAVRCRRSPRRRGPKNTAAGVCALVHRSYENGQVRSPALPSSDRRSRWRRGCTQSPAGSAASAGTGGDEFPGDVFWRYPSADRSSSAVGEVDGGLEREAGGDDPVELGMVDGWQP